MSDWKGRAYVAVGLLVVLTLVLAGLGSAKSNAPKTLTVAWVSDISGPFASYNGSQTEAAAQAAIDAANAKGGVNGYQIKMKVYDAASSPASIELKRERIDYWVSKGAKMSDRVSKIVSRPAPAATASVA